MSVERIQQHFRENAAVHREALDTLAFPVAAAIGRIEPVVATSRNLEVLNGATAGLGLETNREADDAIAGQARCQSV